MESKKEKKNIIYDKDGMPKYDINYFLDKHKRLQYDPNAKDIQYPGRRRKRKYF